MDTWGHRQETWQIRAHRACVGAVHAQLRSRQSHSPPTPSPRTGPPPSSIPTSPLAALARPLAMRSLHRAAGQHQTILRGARPAETRILQASETHMIQHHTILCQRSRRRQRCAKGPSRPAGCINRDTYVTGMRDTCVINRDTYVTDTRETHECARAHVWLPG